MLRQFALPWTRSFTLLQGPERLDNNSTGQHRAQPLSSGEQLRNRQERQEHTKSYSAFRSPTSDPRPPIPDPRSPIPRPDPSPPTPSYRIIPPPLFPIPERYPRHMSIPVNKTPRL